MSLCRKERSENGASGGLQTLSKSTNSNSFSRYIRFSRAEWAHLRASTAMPLSEQDLEQLHGINEQVSLTEVDEIYLPLSRLLNLYVDATRNLYLASSAFLGHLAEKVPYVIGIAGSVAVGKSTTARIIQALLTRWPGHPRVDLVTTDGFLLPNDVLSERGLMERKGFPESYDVRRLIRFLADVKSGRKEVKAPVYSHLTYDIVPGEWTVVRQSDIMIVEGLNVLQTGQSLSQSGAPRLFVSDFFDFTIYVDAEEHLIKQWYVERFHKLRQTAFRQPESFFRRYSTLTEEEASETASRIWDTINGPNLRANILPTRARAHLILTKGEHHSVQSTSLKKL
jgi:type I pantothenate kinase